MMNLYQGDCLEVLKTFPSDSIELVVTSPPYDSLRTYEDSLCFNFESFKQIARELFRVLMPGGVIVWVVGDGTEKASETGTSFNQALYFKGIGLNLHDTMIYNKTSFTFPDPTRYHQAFEYMFVFSKGRPKTFNPISDRENKWAGSMVHGNSRDKDGNTFKKSGNGKIIPEKGRRFNVWTIPNSGKKGTEHPATFPLQLAKDHILSWSNPGDVVLDPFMGSGTTGQACKETEREFVGIEIVPKYFEMSKQRLNQTSVKETA